MSQGQTLATAQGLEDKRKETPPTRKEQQGLGGES